MPLSIKYPHYHVPPCPACGSECTGRYIRQPLIEAWYVEEQSLKNGEIIRFASKELIKNCFCVDCGHEWGQMVKLQFLDNEELEAEVLRRGTREAYEAIHAVNKEKLKRKRKNPVLRVFHTIFG